MATCGFGRPPFVCRLTDGRLDHVGAKVLRVESEHPLAWHVSLLKALVPVPTRYDMLHFKFVHHNNVLLVNWSVGRFVLYRHM